MNAKTWDRWLLIIAVGLLLGGCSAAYLGSRATVHATIKKTERVNRGDSSKYLVFTDQGVFENTDSLLFWKWNSSDLYGELTSGQKVTLRVAGWRIPFLSMYPNVLSVRTRNP